MLWTHRWNGSEGKFIDNLDVDRYLTIFILDAAGDIRAQDQCGDEIEKTVNRWIDELETTRRR